jgi:hypothetical protein
MIETLVLLKKKTEKLNTCDVWCNLIENAGYKNLFVVTKMSISDFFSMDKVKYQIIHCKKILKMKSGVAEYSMASPW